MTNHQLATELAEYLRRERTDIEEERRKNYQHDHPDAAAYGRCRELVRQAYERIERLAEGLPR